MDTNTFPRITGTVQLQRWAGRKEDQIEHIEDVEFDATDAVIAMSFAGLNELQDARDNADEIVQSSHCRKFDSHDGPFDVIITERIDEFLSKFGVDGRAALTEEKWRDVQLAYKAQLPANSTLSAPLSDERRGMIVTHLVEQKAMTWSYEVGESGLMTELRNRARNGFKGFDNMTDAELLHEVRGERVNGLGLVLVA